MYGYIYLTTNKLNNKIYIGQHKSDKFDESYIGSGTNLKRAIKKYGKDNFTIKMIDTCNSKEELDEKEKFWIKEYKSDCQEIGYNITHGGQSKFFTGLLHSQSSKLKMSEKAKNREHPPTTAGRKCVNKDGKNKYIKTHELQKYLEDGYKLGKFMGDYTAWNKGLNSSDNRVQKISNTRKQLFREGNKIGCYGCKGIDNILRQRFIEKVKNIDKNEFYNDWLNNGKCYCIEKYHLNYKSYDYICNLFNIVETNEHKKFIRSQGRLKLNKCDIKKSQ